MMKKFDDILNDVKTIAVTGHVRPDGDCVGSSLGFYNYVKANYPAVEVDVLLQQPGHEFAYMNGYDSIKTSMEQARDMYDLFVVFDCGAEDRFEPFKELLNRNKKCICIDHHMNNTGFADESYVVEDLSSTCELLFTYLEEEKITKESAECLYTGMVTDTGIFRYQSTNAETMRIAGRLLTKGINHTRIIDEAFFMKTYQQNQIAGRCLLESVLFYGGKCIYSYASQKTMQFYGLEGKQMGGVIDELRNTEGVEVAIFLYEIASGEYKVSMRSKDIVDVSAICHFFGGGGHVRAAGCTMRGTVHDIINNIGAQIELQFKEKSIV